MIDRMHTCVIGPHVCSLAQRLEKLYQSCQYIARPWVRPSTGFQRQQNDNFERAMKRISDFLYSALVQHRTQCASHGEAPPLLVTLQGLAALLVEVNFCESCNIPELMLNMFNAPLAIQICCETCTAKNERSVNLNNVIMCISWKTDVMPAHSFVYGHRECVLSKGPWPNQELREIAQEDVNSTRICDICGQPLVVEGSPTANPYSSEYSPWPLVTAWYYGRLASAWEKEKASRLEVDPQLSPARAGHIAAASIALDISAQYSAMKVEVERRGREIFGETDDLLIRFYDELQDDTRQWFYGVLQDISGTRTLLEDEDNEREHRRQT